MKCSNRSITSKIIEVFDELFKHDGFGEMRIEIKILKKGQKEVIIHCGKQYRYIVDCPVKINNKACLKGTKPADLKGGDAYDRKEIDYIKVGQK